MKTVWKQRREHRNTVASNPVIVDDILLVTFGHARGGGLLALDVDSGQELWRFDVNNAVHRAVVDGDDIYLVTYHGDVIRFDRNGNVVWNVRAFWSNAHAPVLADDLVVYADGATAEGHRCSVRALSRISGDLRWERPLAHSTYGLAVGSDRVIYSANQRSGSFGSPDITASLECVDAGSGEILWEDEIEQDQGVEYQTLMFRPTVAGDYVFVGIRGRLLVYSLAAGERLTEFALDDPMDAVLSSGTRLDNSWLFLTQGGCMVKLDLGLEGSTLTPSSPIQTYAHDGLEILAVTENGQLLRIDPDLGKVTYSKKIPAPFKQGYGLVPVGEDLILCVATHCRRVTAWR